MGPAELIEMVQYVMLFIPGQQNPSTSPSAIINLSTGSEWPAGLIGP